MKRIRVQVSCVAVRDGQLALVKRLDNVFPALTNFMLPPSGHVELGETLQEACIREMYEETGLTVADLQLKGVVQFIFHSEDEYHSVCFFFVTNHVVGELGSNNPDEREKLEPHWVSVADIQTSENIPDYHRAFIKHLLTESQFMNAVVEWYPPNDDIQWKILDQQSTYV